MKGTKKAPVVRVYVMMAFTCTVMIMYLAARPAQLQHVTPRPCTDPCEVDASPHFLLHTPGCVVPDIPPDHPSIAKYQGGPQELRCSSKRDLTTTDGLFLLLNDTVGTDYGITSNSDLRCYYQDITRESQDPNKYNGDCDKKFRLGDKMQINKTKTRMGEDAVLVQCENSRLDNEVVYKKVHYFMQPRRAQKKRQEFKRQYGNRSTEQLSVIIMGTDAVSRGNLRRHMPRTFQYLVEELHALDYQGYIKVGDNTDPNLRAVLMGLTQQEFESHPCHPKDRAKYDLCPLVWKDYADHGYATAYAEDAAWMGVFHFNQPGYVEEPTDYYNRPFFLASEKYTAHNAGRGGYNGKLCQGNTPSIRVVHDYSLAVAEALRDMPYFGFYWNAATTHDYLKSVAMADTPSLEYLKSLKEGGFLDHTILVFISDHGLRWGDFRSTYPGMLEERMPYLMVVTPPWFRYRYPSAWATLRANQRALTSPFDTYATLVDILHRAYTDPQIERPQHKHGLSLFTAVPLNRTCSEAGVPSHYCPCQEYQELPVDDPRLRDAAQFVVEELNQSLMQESLCVPLRLNTVVGGRLGSAGNNTKPKSHESLHNTIGVTLRTSPGDALLEATLREHSGLYELTAEVSRINKYGDQSHCTTHPTLRKYCMCSDMLNTTRGQ